MPQRALLHIKAYNTEEFAAENERECDTDNKKHYLLYQYSILNILTLFILSIFYSKCIYKLIAE
ncbi:hypothetical protein ACJX0J_026270, partial [Zea mays]